MGFPGGSDGKESTCNAGDLGSTPELQRFLGGGHGNPLQYSCLERSLVGYSSWGHKESDMTERLSTHLTRWTFVGKEISLLFNMLSRFFIAFLPTSKSLLISWLQSLSAVILEPKKIKSLLLFPLFLHLPWSNETGCHDLCFLNVEL